MSRRAKRSAQPIRLALLGIGILFVLVSGRPASEAAPVLASPAQGQAGHAIVDRPNFIFILVDDLGWGDLACFGNDRIRTPNLDQLAQEGTRFTQFYVASGVCSPTRAAFMTGMFPARLRIHRQIGGHSKNKAAGMPDWLDPTVPTITDILQSAGYATGHFGKWHLGTCCGAPDPGEYGIDDHVTTNSNGPGFPQQGEEFFRAESTRYIVDEVIEFIEENQDRSFYVNVWTSLPHAVLNPTEEQLQVYANLAPNGVPWVGARQIYYASVTAMDEQIGRLMDRLDELGLAEKTLVIFTSDNGPAHPYARNTSHSGVGSAGPFRGGKTSLYEGGVRMPLIVRWPGHVAAGAVDNDSVIAAVDFLPTFTSLANVGFPTISTSGSPLDGEDVSDMLLGSPRPRTTPILWEWRFRPGRKPIHWKAPMLGIRSDNWKLLMNPDWSRVELYDVVADPKEVDNLADVYPWVVELLSAEALAWQATLPPGPVADDAGGDEYPWP